MPWIDGEKIGDCPTCGKQLDQSEYDGQYCRPCKVNELNSRIAAETEQLAALSIELLHSAALQAFEPRAFMYGSCKIGAKCAKTFDATWLLTLGNGEVIERGDRTWYSNGLLHRVDGPAIEYVNGSVSWYRNGMFMSFEQFLATADPEHVPVILTNEAKRLSGGGYDPD